MVKLNSFLIEMENNNIFSNIGKKMSLYKKNNPKNNILSLGVGDVSKPIPKKVIEAMKKAVVDLSSMDTFKGYGSYYGYDFLKEKILLNEYKNYNLSLDEIYISNGTKTDSTSILELFDINSKICITDPMYPIYRDGAACLNRKVELIEVDSNFVAKIPNEKYDIIYICSPSNPIGICYDYGTLKKWVDYAIKNKAVILYDNVYSSFIVSENVPKSIYEVPNAKKVAIEFRSFSKNASFTGVRCSYYVIPKEIEKGINELWNRRTINRFNGADYIAQKGAEAVYTKEAQKEIKNNIDYYHKNAKKLRDSFLSMGFTVFGGIDSPFLWIKTKDNMSSWDYFDFLLKKFEIVVIPGIIFGKNGDEYFRVSALAPSEVIDLAIERLEKYYEKKDS